jgi:DNA mismatch repair protein MutL
LLEEHAELLSQLGIELSQFGTDSFAVQSFPALMKDTPVGPFMADLLDLLDRQPPTHGPADAPGKAAQTEVVIHKVLDLMACKAAVKAGDPLTPDEIEALMRQRHLIEKSSSCPHGRPTMLRLTKEDLNRQFKRT